MSGTNIASLGKNLMIFQNAHGLFTVKNGKARAGVTFLVLVLWLQNIGISDRLKTTEDLHAH